MLDVRANKQWLTAAEAAAERLPGFEYSERQVQYFIRDGELRGRKRVGRGGGREFHWSELPAEARAEYLKRHATSALRSTPDRSPGEAIAQKEDASAREASRALEAEARARIVERAAEFGRERNLTNGKALKAFSAAYARRGAGLDPFVYEAVPKLAPHLVRAWQAKLKDGGTAALIDGRGRPQGSWIEDDPALEQFIIATFAARPHLSAMAIADAIETDLGRALARYPKTKRPRMLRTLQAFLAKLRKDNRALVAGLTDPDRHRSHHKPAFGSRSLNIVRVNQLWEIDATRGDAMCRLPDGSRKRFALTALIDVFTRRAQVVVSDQPRASATQAILRRAILAWGLPETLKADNGKEYRNRAVEAFCRDSGIAISWSRPFCPEEKPHIERFFGTILHQLFETLPGYVAHDIAGRKAIENRRSFAHRFGTEAELAIETSLSPAELQARIDAWLAHVYEQAPHDGLHGFSPAHKALAHAGEEKRLADSRALDALLFAAPDNHGIRTVGKRGVRVGNAFYIAPELGEFMGERVAVRIDPLDLSRAVIYRAERPEFLCIAEDAEAIPNARRMEIAVTAQALQRQQLARVRADVRKVQRLHPPQGLADRLLQFAADQNQKGHAEDAETRSLAMSSAPSAAPREIVLAPESARALEAASTPALRQHARALEAIEQSKSAPQPIPVTEEEREGALAFLEAAQPRRPAPPLVPCDGYTRPFFEDDVDFYRWAESAPALDAEDAESFARLKRSETFQLLLANDRARRAGAAA